MKINPVSAYGAYQQNARKLEKEGGFSAALGAAGRVQKQTTDQISISSQGARQLEAERLTRAVVDEMHRPSDPEKLARITRQVQEGSYRIPTADLADAVMQRWLGL